MTPAQAAALVVMAKVGKPVGAHKRKSQMKPVPRVNTVAASSLAKARLAHSFILRWSSPYSSPYEYRPSDEGIRAYNTARAKAEVDADIAEASFEHGESYSDEDREEFVVEKTIEYLTKRKEQPR